VLEKLVGGADLMLPGLVMPPAGLPQPRRTTTGHKEVKLQKGRGAFWRAVRSERSSLTTPRKMTWLMQTTKIL
ncbi:EIF2D isoform 6, partial [Pan troglodytes]